MIGLFGLLINTFTLMAVIWYACVASQQRDVMQRTEKLSERPRVALSSETAISVQHVQFDSSSNFVDFDLDYSLKNFGPLPADVEVIAHIYDQNYIRWDVLNSLVREACKIDEPAVKDLNHAWPVAIIQEMTYGHTTRFNIPPDSIKRGTIKPTIAGCIWYRSTTTHDVYQTPFSGQLSMKFHPADGRAADGENPEPIRIDQFGDVHSKIAVLDVLSMGDAN